MSNFWKELKAPVFALAPMEDVTDTVFRELVMRVSSPDVLRVVFTEFTSTDGLLHERGAARVSERLIVSESEKKLRREKNIRLVAQIWGNDPEKFLKAAQKITLSGDFDGIDINMGCPVKKVVKKDTCSALIKYPELAKEIVLATREGTSLPVSVKTRIGFNEVATEQWTSHLLETDPAAITLHGRTQKMQSEGRANWDEIGKAVRVRDDARKTTAILGNGDINSYARGMEYLEKYNLDGIMVGRGIFKSPWIFNADSPEPGAAERIKLLLTHLNLFTGFWGERKNFHILRRFFKIYIGGFPGAGQLRSRLMTSNTPEEVNEIIREWEASGFAQQVA